MELSCVVHAPSISARSSAGPWRGDRIGRRIVVDDLRLGFIQCPMRPSRAKPSAAGLVLVASSLTITTGGAKGSSEGALAHGRDRPVPARSDSPGLRHGQDCRHAGAGHARAAVYEPGGVRVAARGPFMTSSLGIVGRATEPHCASCVASLACDAIERKTRLGGNRGQE